MADIDLLTTADVQIVAGDSAAVVDLAGAGVVASAVVAGAGDRQELSPIRSTSPVVQPTSRTWRAALAVYGSDVADRLDTLDSDTSALAVLLTDPAVGWILPGTLHDGAAADAAAQLDNADIDRVQLAWNPTGQARAVKALAAVTADGTATATLPTDGETWFVATAAGTVAGASIKTGVHRLASAAASVAVTGARGWLCQAVTVEA